MAPVRPFTFATPSQIFTQAIRGPSRLSPRACPQRRWLQQDIQSSRGSSPPFAFAFDIDGVLLRSSQPIPGARDALNYLQQQRIPFILLTNGGGKHDAQRVSDLSRALDVPLDVGNFIQSHTPFAELVDGDGDQEALRDKCILVMGGEGDRCRLVAEAYGFRNVISPCDIYHAQPEIWPFSGPFARFHAKHARPLPRPIYPGPNATRAPLEEHLQVHAMFVYNDPRDWGLDMTLIMDLLLSHRGYLGTRSGLIGRSDLPHRGYQQDGQPPLWFSNPDLWWAAQHNLSRLGQGAFRAALEGVWAAETGGGVPLQLTMSGKPHSPTYAYAERRLMRERERLLGAASSVPLERVYMIGDNPASDIAGANSWQSPAGSKWHSLLVRTGVYTGGTPAHAPAATVADVGEAVRWALAKEGWGQTGEEEGATHRSRAAGHGG